MALTFRETYEDTLGDDNALDGTLGAVGIAMELLLAGNVSVDRKGKPRQIATTDKQLVAGIDFDDVPGLTCKSFTTRFVIGVTNHACQNGN